MKISVPNSPTNSASTISRSLSFHSMAGEFPNLLPTQDPAQLTFQNTTMGIQRAQNQWPCWNGTPSSFDFFMLRLKIKAQDEAKAAVSAEMICLNMVEAIPDVKKQRLSPWFKKRQENNNYSWQDLHSYMFKSFSDKTNDLAAAQTLARMRQGKHQFFHDFIKDFEHQLALAGGENWPSASKLSHLSTAINKSLEDALVYVDLPSEYDEWVVKVRRTAGKLENLSRYRPPNSKLTETWYINDIIVTMPVPNHEEKPRGIDSEGDTIMGNNSLEVLSLELRKIGRKLEKLENNGRQSQGRSQKPHAPWRPKNEFFRLIEEGLCTRCAKPGHQSQQCPSFRGPKKVQSEVNLAFIQGKENSGNEGA